MTAAQDFLDLWKSGDSSSEARAKLNEILSKTPLSGRMIHGNRTQEGFGVHLSFDEWKRLSWVFGPEAIRKFLGLSARDICLELGMGENWLDAKLEQGAEFVLVIFPSDSADVRPATWDGIEYFLKRHYSDVWYKVNVHWPQIKSLSYEEFRAIAGYDLEAVNLVGRYDHKTGESRDDRYVSLQRLKRRNGTLVEVRQFLWDEIGLRQHYTGSGYTKNDNGQVGVPEYLAQNKKLDDIDGLIKIQVVPTKGSFIGKTNAMQDGYVYDCCNIA